MNLEPRAHRKARLLVAACLLASAAAGAAISTHFTGVPASASANEPRAAAPTATAPRADGLPIDHSIVRQFEQEAPEQRSATSLGAYGA